MSDKRQIICVDTSGYGDIKAGEIYDILEEYDNSYYINNGSYEANYKKECFKKVENLKVESNIPTYVKCINTKSPGPEKGSYCLLQDKVYTVVKENDTRYVIKNEMDDEYTYPKSNFKQVYKCIKDYNSGKFTLKKDTFYEIIQETTYNFEVITDNGNKLWVGKLDFFGINVPKSDEIIVTQPTTLVKKVEFSDKVYETSVGFYGSVPQQVNEGKKTMSNSPAFDSIFGDVMHGIEVGGTNQATDFMMDLVKIFVGKDTSILSTVEGRMLTKFAASFALKWATFQDDKMIPLPKKEFFRKIAGMQLEATSRDYLEPKIREARELIEKFVANGAASGAMNNLMEMFSKSGVEEKVEVPQTVQEKVAVPVGG
jgi:hypothetical protein